MKKQLTYITSKTNKFSLEKQRWFIAFTLLATFFLLNNGNTAIAQTPTCSDGSYQYSDMLAFLSVKCGSCHTSGSTGGFNLNTYAGLLAGGNNCGVGVTPGNATAAGSSIIEKTQHVVGGVSTSCGNNMPTNGNNLTPAEFMALEQWINAGAPEFCPAPPPTDLACSGGGGLSITEILADPNSGNANLDANCDGVADAGDDYLIICNNSGADIDISGFEVYDNSGLAFTFPAGTILAAGGCAVVVDTWPAASGPIPPNVFSGGPGINNGGDQLILYDPNSGTYQSVIFNGFTLDTSVLPAGATTACDEDWGSDTDGMPLTNAGPGDNSLPYECMTPTCAVTNVTVTADGACAGDDATYTVCADVAGGSGDYDLIDTGNGNAILSSLTAQVDGNICYTVTLTGPTTASTIMVDVVDNADATCISGMPTTVTIPVCPVVVAMCETLVITEVMYDPCSGGAGTDDCLGGAGTFWDDEANSEWVEIYNYGPNPVDVSGYLIGDSAGSDVYEIPAGTILQPGDYLVIGQAAIIACMQAAGINAVVGCDPGNCPTPQAGPRFNNGGDDVELKDPTGMLCDIITYTGDECGAGDNDGYTFSLNLDPSTFVDGTENDNPADYGVSLAGGDTGSFGGGSPGVLNTLGACVSNITEVITATCNGTDAVLDISFDYEGSFVTDYDIIVNGAVLTTSAGNMLGMGTVTETITIPNSTTATTITLDVRPPGAPDNICNDTSITIDLPACMDTTCPMAVTVPDVSEIICNGGLANLYSDFQAAVLAANPLDATQDPDGWGTIVYSGVTLNTGDTPNPPVIDGIHNGINPCAPVPQEAFAYIQCDMGTADTTDDTFILISNFALEIWLEPTLTVPADPGCGITLVTDCNDMANETIEYSTDGGANFTSTAPTLNPGDADVTVTYQISNPGCTITGMYDLTCPPTEMCSITPAAAVNIVCDDNGTPEDPTDDTYTFDIMVSGNNPAAGASNTFNDDQGNVAVAYGTTLSYGPFPIAGGNISVTFTDADDLLCTAMMMATAPATCSVPVCDIADVVITQNCTDNGEEYEVCISFMATNPGVSGTFDVYIDAPGTTTPTTLINTYTYAAYDAAIAGGATCFTIPLTDYAGDATDLETGIPICIADSDAPAPGTGLPPGTVPMGGGLPNPECTSIIGIFANACGSNEGQNEFVVLQNGNTGITGNDIVIDTPANDDYDMWEPAATTATNIAAAGWICSCCVAIDGSSAIPANAVVIVTGNMLDQPYDFTGLCTAAGTVYVLGESSTSTGGHFSNGGGRTTVLNVTNAGANCNYPQSYTYLTSDLVAGGDGDYISFSAPDNPTQPAGNNDDPAGTNGTGSNNGCTGPEVVAQQEVECFACGSLDEMACMQMVTCPVGVEVVDGITVCSGDPITVFTDWQTEINVANPLDMTQDPDNLGTILYSSTQDDMTGTWIPDEDVSGITGVHSGVDVCALEDQTVYAYLFCSSDNVYEEIGSFTVTVFPLIEDAVTLNNDGGCCPAVSIACPDYLVSNDYDINGSIPDCVAETGTGSITFTIELAVDPIGGACLSYEVTAAYDCVTAVSCPSFLSFDEDWAICTNGLTTEITDWQDAVNSEDAIADANTGDAVIFSTNLPIDVSEAIPPTPGTIDGIHSGADICVSETQTLYAYLLCFGADGIAGGGDDSYLLLGTYVLAVYPLIEDAVNLNNDGGCCPSVTISCPGYLVDNSYDANGAMPDCSDEMAAGNITFTITTPETPAQIIDVTCLSYEVLGAYDCGVPICQITPDMATNIVCEDAGTPEDPSDDTFTFDITVSGNSTFPGTSNTFSDDQGNTGIAYGTMVSYGPFPIAGGNVTVNFTDTEQADCTGMMMATAPMTCSAGPCEDEIAGNIFGPTGCDLTGIEVTIYDSNGNVVVVLNADMNGMYDSSPTAYPCGEYSVELTNGIPQCYVDAMGETGPKPFLIDGDADGTDTDGPDFMPVGIPTLSQWGLICLALLMMIFGAVALGRKTLIFEKKHLIV